jgi:hypothetical protein
MDETVLTLESARNAVFRWLETLLVGDQSVVAVVDND